MTLDEAVDYARAVGLTDRQIAVVVRAEADRVRFEQDNGEVTLTHPVLGTQIRVAPDAVAQHELAGWVQEAADEPEPEPEPEAEAAPAAKKASK